MLGGHKVVKVVNLIRPGGIDRADIDAIRTVYIQAGEQLVGVFCYVDFLCQIVKGNEDFTRLGNRFCRTDDQPAAEGVKVEDALISFLSSIF